MQNPKVLQSVQVKEKSPEILEPKSLNSVFQNRSLRDAVEQKHNTLSKKEVTEYGGVLGERVKTMSDDDIKKDFIKLIDNSGLDDEFLLKKLHEGILKAEYQGPKGEIMTDRKTITQIVKLIFQLKGKLKDNSQIQIINAFGQTGIVL